jgi:hypothetical protein
MVTELTAGFHKAAFLLATTDPHRCPWGRKSLGKVYSGYWRQAVLWQPDCMIGDPGLQSQIASAMRTYGVQPASGDD